MFSTKMIYQSEDQHPKTVLLSMGYKVKTHVGADENNKTSSHLCSTNNSNPLNCGESCVLIKGRQPFKPTTHSNHNSKYAL